ncbi:MAG: T9SS type A sorting domain-containing protein [candidate division Zixibacteria bacterium]|nr:T9SS type A sorting domain-containing protein [candidate division Zixibacteria bacterium]
MNAISRNVVITMALFLAIYAGALSAEDKMPSIAPTISIEQDEMPPGMGFIPPPMDLSHLKGQTIPEHPAALDLPTQYDWRQQSKVTAVRNQGSCGACYAFAALANIESKMLIDGAGTYDFSENNIKECNFYETSCNGGNFMMMANFLSKAGTVLEADDAYVPSNTACNSACTFQKTLLDWRMICGNSVPEDSVLKNYIYNYGPVYTSLYAGNGDAWDTEFGGYDGSYTLYYTGGETTNHAVFIVGWDDSLSHAGGTGGWIVKNSWGTSWGGICGYGSENGYFTIAYGSASIGKYSSYMYSWQNFDDNGELYFYDEGGWALSFGYNDTTAYGMCKFTPSQNTYLTGVELWTTDITTDIDIYIYDDFDGTNLANLLASKENSSFNEAGYHSIALTTPLTLTNADPIYVKVKFLNDSYGYPLPIDDQGSFETSTTYYSHTGANGSWSDLGANYSADLGIRIRTTTVVGIDDINGLKLPESIYLSQNYPNPFNAKTTIEYGIPEASHVAIDIYDMLGRKIETIVNDYKSAGVYKVNWNSNDIPSGVYFYRLKAGTLTEAKPMLLLK